MSMKKQIPISRIAQNISERRQKQNAMTKKLYYKFDPNNGEPWIIDGNLHNLMSMIVGEMETIKKQGDEEGVELSITFVWMTDEEFAVLPEAY